MGKSKGPSQPAASAGNKPTGSSSSRSSSGSTQRRKAASSDIDDFAYPHKNTGMSELKLWIIGITIGSLILSGVVWHFFRSKEYVIHDAKSELNGRVIVTNDGWNVFTIYFTPKDEPWALDHPRQGVTKLKNPNYVYFPYHRIMLTALTLLPKPPQRVLVIGLGAGTIPMFVRKHFKKAVIDVVEKDKMITVVAQRYFQIKSFDNKFQIHIEAGRDFIEESKKTYDIIFQDSCSGPPCDLFTLEAAQLFKQMLKPKGILVINSEAHFDGVMSTFQSTFPQVLAFKTEPHQHQLFCFDQVHQNATQPALVSKASEMSESLGLSFNLGRAVTRYWLGDYTPRGNVVYTDNNINKVVKG